MALRLQTEKTTHVTPLAVMVFAVVALVAQPLCITTLTAYALDGEASTTEQPSVATETPQVPECTVVDPAKNDETEHQTVEQSEVEAPGHVSPQNASEIIDSNPTFTWSSVEGSVCYELQISQSDTIDSTTGELTTDSRKEYVQVDSNNSEQPSTEVKKSVSLSNGIWYWQVRAVNEDGIVSKWTSPWKVTITMSTPTTPTDPTTPTTPSEPTTPTPNTSTTPTVPIVPVDTTAPVDDGGVQPTTELEPQNNTQLFTAPLLASNAILGDQTQTTTPAPVNDQAVKGVETTRNSQESKASTGTIAQRPAGLAWYWWLAIIAGLTTLWLVFAAYSRRRRANATN